eukprot:TRINITY_DN25445_c0_g1_i1.p1 TRINITY_DN25445_c0_g1~~TRINITY_DN25445_c0_g1_i1.p1  ORF type:complete len:333 (-),score=91.02 TRINITY_DN25445_c0_g1_i1:56-1009(-)
MSEQFQLRKSSFSCDLSVSLSSLLASSSLCDVTLIFEDGHLSAHKVILAASSSFFSSVFSLNHHKHPLIYLRGIKTVQMKALLDYIYSGTTQVIEEDLAGFLAVAEDLKIDGLMKDNKQPAADMKEIIKTENSNDKGEFAVADTESTINDDDAVTEMNTNVEIDTISDEMGNENETYEVAEAAMCPVSVNGESMSNDDKNLNVTRKRTTKREADDNQTVKKKPRTPKPKTEMPKPTTVATSNVTILSNPAVSPMLASSKKFPLQCHICNTGVPTKFYLQAHMQMKSETQCKDCKLFFSSCQSLAFHKKGRCRKLSSQ